MSLGEFLHALIVLPIYVLATARLTRLVNYDIVLDTMATAVASRAEDDERSAKEQSRWATLLEFIGCPWCVSFYFGLAGAVPVVLVLHWSLWLIPALALACSHLVGRDAPKTADPRSFQAR